jgi:hypothetical protein
LKTTSLLTNQPGRSATQPIKLLEADGSYQEPLIVSTYGPEGSGKSAFCGTAPGAIGVLPTEHKSRQSILKSAEEHGKRVILPEIDLVRSSRPMLLDSMPAACVVAEGGRANWTPAAVAGEMARIGKSMTLDGDTPSCCQQHFYRWHVGRAKSVLFRMYDMVEIKTIVIDTFGQLVEDLLFANYGRTDSIMPLDKKSFNQEVRDLLNNLSGKNLILTHHESAVWKDNKPTTRTKPTSSFNKLGHYTSVMIHQKRDVSKALGDGRYVVTVDDCQANVELIGLDLLVDEGIAFQNLAALVYPESSGGEWE